MKSPFISIKSPYLLWGFLKCTYPQNPVSCVTCECYSYYAPLKPEQHGGLLPQSLVLEQGYHKSDVKLLCQ